MFLCSNRAFLFFNIYYLYQQMHIYTYIVKIIILQMLPTCFGASEPSSGSLYIAFDKVTDY